MEDCCFRKATPDDLQEEKHCEYCNQSYSVNEDRQLICDLLNISVDEYDVCNFFKPFQDRKKEMEELVRDLKK